MIESQLCQMRHVVDGILWMDDVNTPPTRMPTSENPNGNIAVRAQDILNDVIHDRLGHIVPIQTKGTVKVFKRIDPNEPVMNEWHG